MKTLILILALATSICTQSQEWLRSKNTISLYGGLSTEGIGIKYSRTFNQHENKFSEIEIGGGRGLILVLANATAGLSFNRGKNQNYFTWGFHYSYMRFDFFRIADFHSGYGSIGYHYRNKNLDFKFRALMGITSIDGDSLPLPGLNASLGWSF